MAKTNITEAKPATFEATPEEEKVIMEGLRSINESGTLPHDEAVAMLRLKYPNIIL